MNRMHWIGKHVLAKDPVWGTYIGELVEVSDRLAKVKIYAVRKCPTQGDLEHPHWLPFWESRQPLEYGKVHEFAKDSIELYEDEVPPYLTSLVAAMDREIESLYNMKRWVERNLEEYFRQKAEVVGRSAANL